MKSRAQTRTDSLLAKLEAVKLSPLEVLQRALAMAESNGDYKNMSEVALSVLPYMAPKLQATEVVSESTTTNRNVDMSLDELEEELRKIEEMEKLAGYAAETDEDENAKPGDKASDTSEEA